LLRNDIEGFWTVIFKSPYLRNSVGSIYLMAAVAMTLLFPGIAMADFEGTIIDVLMGEPVPIGVMVDDLATVRIVYIGELHTIARHHRVQTKIMRLMADRGLKLALGMEMFAATMQPILDKWQEGSHSVARLKMDLGEYWTNLEDYESLLITARDLKIPIVGLNAADDLVRKVARKGLEGLSEAEKKAVPEGTNRINPLNDRLLRIKLKVHRAFKDKSLDRIVLAQALRDETMAGSLERFLDSAEGRSRIMIVVAGSGHINYGFGIPERAFRLNRLPHRIIIPSESGDLVLSEEEKRQSMPLNITHQDLRFIQSLIADYLIVTPLKKEKSQESIPHEGTLSTRR
jgi:uncharacterized iron-regulated protein